MFLWRQGFNNWMFGDEEEMYKPNTTDKHAKELVEKLYGMNVLSVAKMNGYDDQNYRIEVSPEHTNLHIKELCRDGYTLKVMNTLESKNTHFIDGMHQAIEHMRKKGFYVPEPVPNVHGKLWSSEFLPVKENNRYKGIFHSHCVVRLLTFIPGTIIYNVPSRFYNDIVFQWGKLLARFQNALEEFHYPPSLEKRTSAWSLMNVPDVKTKMGALTHLGHKKLCWSILEEFDKIYPRLKRLPHVLIHGDFNEQNLVATEKPQEGFQIHPNYVVYGVLDFGDLHLAPTVCDVAVMLAYAILACKEQSPVKAAGYALAGYLSVKRLSNEELSYLRVCIASRICQSLTLGAVAYQLDPSNEYVMITSRAGWNVLYKLWSSPEEVVYEGWKSVLSTFKDIDTSDIDFTSGRLLKKTDLNTLSETVLDEC